MDLCFITYMNATQTAEVNKAKDLIKEMGADEIEALLIAISHTLNDTANNIQENDGDDYLAEPFIDAAFGARTAARDLAKRFGN